MSKVTIYEDNSVLTVRLTENRHQSLERLLKEQVYTDPFTEVSIDWCYDHDGDGHDKEGDSHNLYTEAE